MEEEEIKKEKIEGLDKKIMSLNDIKDQELRAQTISDIFKTMEELGYLNEPKCKKRRYFGWLPPNEVFNYGGELDFEEKYPLGYRLVQILMGIVIIIPLFFFIYHTSTLEASSNSPLFLIWGIIGIIGCFIIGRGFYNVVSVIFDQYEGHLCTISSLVLGGIILAISMIEMGKL